MRDSVLFLARSAKGGRSAVAFLRVRERHRIGSCQTQGLGEPQMAQPRCAAVFGEFPRDLKGLLSLTNKLRQNIQQLI